MDSETFNCDVCAEPIAIQDTTAHIITHQTQLLNLVNRLSRNNISLINHQDTDIPTERRQNRLPRCPECQHTPRRRSQDLIRHYAIHYHHKATCPDCRDTFDTNASVFLAHPCFKKPSYSLRKARDDLKLEIDNYLKRHHNIQTRGTRRINYARHGDPPRTIPNVSPTNDSTLLQIRQETQTETLYDAPVRTDGINNEQSLPEAPGRHTQSTLPTGLPFQQLSQPESGPCDGYIESHFQAGRVAHHILPPHDIPLEMQFEALRSSSGLYGQSCQSLEEQFQGHYMGQDGNENGI